MNLLSVVTFATIIAVSTACSCLPISPREAYETVGWASRVLILSKTMENASDPEQPIVYTVRHLRVFKNVNRKRPLCTEIKTASNTASCGVPFLEPGMEYLLLGNFDANGEPNINLCTPVIEWKDVPDLLLIELKAAKLRKKFRH